jgi:hypothetical protein
MSAAFKSMSDLVADSEDLLVRIGRSEIPQVRALVGPFRHSVDQLKALLRNRAKQLRRLPSLSRPAAKRRGVRVVAAALLTSVTVTWLCTWGKRRS